MALTAQTLQIGPLVLPTGLLLLVLATLAALGMGRLLARRSGTGAVVEAAVHRGLLLGLVAARLGFVLQFRSAYFATPWSLLDLRDGGWDPQIGLVAVWIYVFTKTRRAAGAPAALRRPLLGALGAASTVWVAGTLAMLTGGPGRQPLPAFEAQTLHGRPVALADFSGRPTVLSLWATWCPPCRREMPLLQQAQQAHADVHFVFLNQGESAAVVQRYLHGQQLALDNVLLDPLRQVARDFGQPALPTTLFFDAGGRLVSLRVGELSGATLAQHLRGAARRR